MMRDGEMEMEIESAAAPPLLGQKRPPNDDLESEQRLAKRFNLLNLGHNGQFYIPNKAPPLRRSRSNAISDAMPVDESRDKMYIHNLDEEISDAESEEERLIFLPDIEKKLAQLPKSVLSTEAPPSEGKEMILYTVPESISIPKDQDNVRKAILESRHRAQVKHATGAEEADPGVQRKAKGIHEVPNLDGGMSNMEMTDVANDADAMELG